MKLKRYKLLAVNQKIVGSSPIIPALLGHSLMVEYYSPKVGVEVRFLLSQLL